MPMVLAYYPNLSISNRAPELVFHIPVFECFVCVPLFHLSALVVDPVGFSTGFTGVDGIAAPYILLLLPEDV